MLHSKVKGNIGQFATALAFARHGFSVFTEEGDMSKIDLIAEKDGKLIRVQCKAITPKNGALNLLLYKNGPGYRFTYDLSMFDYFAVMDLNTERVYLVPVEFLGTRTSGVNLRVDMMEESKHMKTMVYAEQFDIDNVLNNL